jgi:hypothetical protein
VARERAVARGCTLRLRRSRLRGGGGSGVMEVSPARFTQAARSGV